MNACICCDSKLLRHLNRDRVYWFCPYCHQEMPSKLLLNYLSSDRAIKSKMTRKQFNLIRST